MSWEKHTVPGTGIDFVDYSPWNRRTIADGTWLQNNTLAPIYHNEEILASAIYDSSAKLHGEISAASGSLKSKIKSTSAYLQSEIDTMKAATDVVDVVNSYSELLSYSSYITSGDIVKVLNCCATWGSGETYRTYSGEQVYWRYSGSNVPPPSAYDSGNWYPIGSLDPYYSKAEVDRMLSDTSGYIDSKISVVSGDISIVSSSLYEFSGSVSNSAQSLNQYITNVSSDLDEFSGSVSNSAYTLNQYISNVSSDLDEVSGAVSNSAQSLYDLISETSGKGRGNDIWRLWVSNDSGTIVSGKSYYPNRKSVKVKFSNTGWEPYFDTSANLYGTMIKTYSPSLPPDGVYRWNAEIVFNSVNPLMPYLKGYDISVEWDKPNSTEKYEEFLSTIYFDMSTSAYQHNYIGGIVSTVGNSSRSDFDFYIKPKDNPPSQSDGLEVGQIKMGRLWVNQIG